MKGFKKRKEDKKRKKGVVEPQEPSLVWGITTLDEANFDAGLHLLEQCFSWLEEHDSLDKEGIFRKAGSEEQLSALQALTRYSKTYSFLDTTDEHSIATLIKRYFREMKTPLLTHDLYSTFVAMGDEEESKRVELITTTIQLLPDYNKTILKTLMLFLNKVASKSDLNKMTPNNLAIVFAPNLLCPKNMDPFVLIGDASYVATVVSSMISSVHEIFQLKQAQDPTDHVELQTVVNRLRDRYSLLREQNELDIEDNDDEIVRQKATILSMQIRDGHDSVIGIFDGERPKERRTTVLRAIDSITDQDISNFSEVEDESAESEENLPISDLPPDLVEEALMSTIHQPLAHSAPPSFRSSMGPSPPSTPSPVFKSMSVPSVPAPSHEPPSFAKVTSGGILPHVLKASSNIPIPSPVTAVPSSQPPQRPRALSNEAPAPPSRPRALSGEALPTPARPRGLSTEVAPLSPETSPRPHHNPLPESKLSPRGPPESSVPPPRPSLSASSEPPPRPTAITYDKSREEKKAPAAPQPKPDTKQRILPHIISSSGTREPEPKGSPIRPSRAPDDKLLLPSALPNGPKPSLNKSDLPTISVSGDHPHDSKISLTKSAPAETKHIDPGSANDQPFRSPRKKPPGYHQKNQEPS